MITRCAFGFAVGSAAVLVPAISRLDQLPTWARPVCLALLVMSMLPRVVPRYWRTALVSVALGALLSSSCFGGLLSAYRAYEELAYTHPSGLVARAEVVDPVGLLAERQSMVIRILSIGSEAHTYQSTDQGMPPGQSVDQYAPDGTADVADEIHVLVYMAGEVDDHLLPGDTITISGVPTLFSRPRNFGAPDYRSIYFVRSIMGYLDDGVVEDSEQARYSPLRHPVKYLLRLICDARLSIASRLRSLIDDRSAGIVASASIGVTSLLDSETRETFSRCGMSHLLSVSGMHVGFVSALLGAVVPLLSGRRHGRGRRHASLRLVTSALLILYAALAGLRAPVVRAVVMFLCASIGSLSKTPWSARRVVEAVGLGFLIADPVQLLDVSFQLSFAASYSIAVVIPIIFGRRPAQPSLSTRSVRPLAVFGAAQAGTIPLTVMTFGGLSTVGLPAGIVGAPILGIGCLAAITGALLTYLPPPARWLGGAVASAGSAVIGWLACAADWIGSFPVSYIGLSHRSCCATALSAIGLWAFIPLLRRHGITRRVYAPRWHLLVPVCLMLLPILYCVVVDAWGTRSLELDFLSVGQGDSIVALLPGGGSLAVDAGPSYAYEGRAYDSAESVIEPFMRWRGIRRLDTLVITHFHSDHVGGLQYLLDRQLVGSVCARSVDSVVSGQASWQLPTEGLTRKAFGIPLVGLSAGDELDLGDVQVSVLHPQRLGVDALSENDRSIVLLMRYRSFSVVLVGDAGVAVEPRLARSIFELVGDDGVTILKVGHHGSSGSSSMSFLSLVSPSVAIISTGPNGFGHPSPVTLDRLSRQGCDVFRTDIDGGVRVWTNGEAFKVSSSASRRSLEGTLCTPSGSTTSTVSGIIMADTDGHR